jgi:hypothetical protein
MVPYHNLITANTISQLDGDLRVRRYALARSSRGDGKGDLRVRRYDVARSSRGDGKVEAIRASLNPPAVLFNHKTRDMLLGQVFSGSTC